jgi:surface antigen
MYPRLTVLAALPLLLSQSLAQHPAHAAGAERHAPGKKCDKTRKKSNPLGSFLGSVAGSALGSAGVPSSVAGIYLPVHSLLSEGIIALLNCKEQQQAAEATQQAVRGGVGTTASWQSENRPSVSGSSTVTGQTARADGSRCMTVNDVIIVNGEETTVPKTMCRAPGASGYVLAA